MKRIIMVLTVALVMAAMVVVSAMPALANKGGVPNLGNSVAAHNCQANFATLGYKNVGECVSAAAHL